MRVSPYALIGSGTPTKGPIEGNLKIVTEGKLDKGQGPIHLHAYRLFLCGDCLLGLAGCGLRWSRLSGKILRIDR